MPVVANHGTLSNRTTATIATRFSKGETSIYGEKEGVFNMDLHRMVSLGFSGNNTVGCTVMW